MAYDTALTITDAPGAYPTDGVAVSFDAADTTDQNNFPMTGRELVLAWNTDGADPYTVTIKSVTDERGRTGDITEDSIAAGAVHVYGPFKSKAGWVQSTGNMHLEASNAAIKFAVIRLPN